MPGNRKRDELPVIDRVDVLGCWDPDKVPHDRKETKHADVCLMRDLGTVDDEEVMAFRLDRSAAHDLVRQLIVSFGFDPRRF